MQNVLTGADYLDVVAIRAMQLRGRVFRTQVGPMSAIVCTLVEQIALNRMEYCVVAASFDELNGFIVGDFARHAAAYARSQAAGLVGFTTSVITLVGLASPIVRPDAAAVATADPKFQFSGETRPVAVDLTTGARHFFSGTKAYGFAGLLTPLIQGGIRTKAQTVFPFPAEAERDLMTYPRPQIPDGFPAGPVPGQPGPQPPYQQPGPQQPGPPPQSGPYQQPGPPPQAGPYQQPGPYGR